MSASEVVFENVAEIEIYYAAAPTGGAARRRQPDPAALVAVASVRAAKPLGPDAEAAADTYLLDLEAGTAQAVDPAQVARPSLTDTDAIAADALQVSFDRIRRLRLPVSGIVADWDESGTAGVFRLAGSRRTVTMPAGESADGHSLVWSPGRLRLTVATAADPCSERPEVTLYVVDAATGSLRALHTGRGDFAPLWLDDDRLAYMQGRGADSRVTLVDVRTGTVLSQLGEPGGAGTTHLPRHRCPPPPADAVDDPPSPTDASD